VLQLSPNSLEPPRTQAVAGTGLDVVQAGTGKGAFVVTQWDRGMSYLKIGWRWRRQGYQRGWQAFVHFWLDPTLDSAPPSPHIRPSQQNVSEQCIFDVKFVSQSAFLQ